MSATPQSVRRARTGSELMNELKMLVDDTDAHDVLEQAVHETEQQGQEEEEMGGTRVVAATLIGVSVDFQVAAKDIPTKTAPGATPTKTKNTATQFADNMLSTIKQQMLSTEVQRTQQKAGGETAASAPLAIVEDEFDPWVSLVSKLTVECLPPYHAGRLPVFPTNFTWLKMLQHLELINHDFSNLPSTMSNLVELRELTIGNCRLKSVSEISALIKLQKLNLCYNKITSLSKVFQSLTGLQTLIVSNNQLKEIPSEMKGLTRLQYADFSHNRITKLNDSIKQCTELTHLNLEANQLGSGVLNRSPLSALTALQSLELLNVCNNKLTNLPSFSNLSKLVKLLMAENQISSLPSGLEKLTLLQTFDVSSNALVELTSEAFNGLISLKRFSFVNNKCKFIPASLANSTALTALDGSNNRLTAIPDALGKLVNLKEMKLSDNALVLIPQNVFGTMKCLEVLELTNNALARLPVDFTELKGLIRCDLTGNKLQLLPDDLGSLPNLTHLHVGGNLLKALPKSIGTMGTLRCLELHANPTLHVLPTEFLQLTELKEISLTNFKIDQENHICSVITADGKKGSSSSSSSKYTAEQADLSQLTSMVRNCPHLLLVYALAEFSLHKEHHAFLRLHIGDILYLVSLYNTIPVVSLEAARALVSLATNPELRTQIVDTADLQVTIYQLGMQEEYPLLAAQALNTVANLVLDPGIKEKFLAKYGTADLLQKAQTCQVPEICAVARKILATLGDTSDFDTRMSFLPAKRGLRILAMDGGGTKSVSTIAILQAIEKKTGRKIYELFDLICGTSVGGILACLLGVQCFDAPHVEVLQKKFFKEVFSTKGGQSETGLSQKFSLLSNMISTGGRYDTANFERILREVFSEESLIDSSQRPAVAKVFVASVLMDYFPPAPFLFRNYDYKPGQRSRYAGTCERKVWEGIRATSAAPSMFSECIYDGMRFSDGGMAVNNPTGLAYHEALRIWGKDRPIDCIVSVGTGGVEDKAQSKGIKDFVLSVIESATSVARIDDVMEDFFGKEIYYRFNVVDDSFDVILDETRDERLQAMTDASNRYVESENLRITKCSAILGGASSPAVDELRELTTAPPPYEG